MNYVAMTQNCTVNVTAGHVRLSIVAGNYTPFGLMYSGNMAEGMNVSLVVHFGYNCSIPGGASILAQYSQDNATWVNHNGIVAWDNLTDGSGGILLTGLSWAGNFYYRINMTRADPLSTPYLYDVTVCYQVGEVVIENIFNIPLFILFALSLAMNLLFMRGGQVTLGAMSWVSWWSTALYWIGSSEVVLPSVAWLFFGLGMVSLIMTVARALKTISRSEEEEEQVW